MLYSSAFSCSLLLSLAATVSASPVETIAKRKSGTAVPIHKHRIALSNDDGVFDIEKANALTVVTHNKHRQNLLNIGKNLGVDKLNIVRI